MDIRTLKCPKCGGNLEVKGDQDVIFCEYCGSKILLQHSKKEQQARERAKREKEALEKAQQEFERKKREIEELEEQAKLQNKQNGDDSLVRVIVVVAIILLLCSILIPAMCGFISDSKANYNAKKETITQNLAIQNFTFDLPDYWDEEGSDKDIKQYYAKNEDSEMVMLSIAYPKETDKKYDVSYEGLEKDNSNMIKSFEKTYKDCGVYNTETYENKNGVKGILYSFNYVQKIDWFTKEDATGYCFVFPSEDDRRWFYVTFLYTNNVDDSTYKDDFMNMLATITEKGVKEDETTTTTITTTATTKDKGNKFLDEIFGDK